MPPRAALSTRWAPRCVRRLLLPLPPRGGRCQRRGGRHRRRPGSGSKGLGSYSDHPQEHQTTLQHLKTFKHPKYKNMRRKQNCPSRVLTSPLKGTYKVLTQFTTSAQGKAQSLESVDWTAVFRGFAPFTGGWCGRSAICLGKANPGGGSNCLGRQH